jgi:hypothetical protein
MAITFSIEGLDFAAGEVNPLNTSAGISVRQTLRRHALGSESEPAIIANIDFAIRADSCAIGAAAGFGNYLLDAIRPYPSKGAARNLDDQDAAVFHRDGAFGESQS